MRWNCAMSLFYFNYPYWRNVSGANVVSISEARRREEHLRLLPTCRTLELSKSLHKELAKFLASYSENVVRQCVYVCVLAAPAAWLQQLQINKLHCGYVKRRRLKACYENFAAIAHFYSAAWDCIGWVITEYMVYVCQYD